MPGDVARTVDRIDGLAAGDRVLFNDRRQPLEVVEAGADRALLDGPQGGEYVLFHAPDDLDLVLVARPGHREYASKVDELRVVGQWERVDAETWRHTGSGAAIRLERTDVGTWTVAVDDFPDADPDLPRYGFTDREKAVDVAERLVKRYPEG